MSKSLNFGIEFHGPFRVATGLASRGADVAVNREDPLPATSLKGLMRDAAHTRLGLPAATVDAVFGSTAEPSPWSWTRGVVASTLATRTRVRIDRDSGTVDQGALIVGEELWANDNGHFKIHQRLRVGDERGRDIQIAVLHASGAAVHALGADRQRGFGWVSIVPEGVDWDSVFSLLSLLGDDSG